MIYLYNLNRDSLILIGKSRMNDNGYSPKYIIVGKLLH